MIEGLGRFSILGDSALKVYHSYSSRELACDAETAEVLVEKKSQRATNRFLTAFDAMVVVNARLHLFPLHFALYYATHIFRTMIAGADLPTGNHRKTLKD